MRPHQWVKNLFVLAPLIFSMNLFAPVAIMQAALGCAAFCLMSSSLYIINDIIDADADRAHPTKRFRPIASGELTVGAALTGSASLLILGLGIGVSVGWAFLAVAVTYYVLTLSYCLALKKVAILDCMVIAMGFALRLVGGSAAIGVASTNWLIICAFLLALILAFVKRRQELMVLSESAKQHRAVLGDYTIGFLDQVISILVAAAIVCYALYTVDPNTQSRFDTDWLIYGTVFVIYGLLRYVAIIEDPTRGGDPSKVLVSDKGLILTILGWVVYNTFVIYQHTIFGAWT